MSVMRRRWALRIVRNACLSHSRATRREMTRTLLDRATMLGLAVQLPDKQAIQISAALMPMDILAECRLSDRLAITIDEIRDMLGAVGRAAGSVGEVDGLAWHVSPRLDVGEDNAHTRDLA